MKICTKCKIEKPFTEFCKRPANSDGIRAGCKVCDAAYRAANRDSIRARGAADYVKNKESILFARAEYYALNREIILARCAAYSAKNRDSINARIAAYRAENPELRAIHQRNRRALKKKAEGTHTAADVMAIFEHQRGLCANCHTKLFKSGKNKFHADHIVALARGGSNDKSNLQCLCPPCNLSKHAKDPITWAQENGRLL